MLLHVIICTYIILRVATHYYTLCKNFSKDVIIENYGLVLVVTLFFKKNVVYAIDIKYKNKITFFRNYFYQKHFNNIKSVSD